MEKRVLIIDDSSVDRTLMARLLSKSGITSVQAASADEAFPVLREGGGFSHLLIDWNMPGLSGVELVEVIRQLPWGGECRIVMVMGEIEMEKIHRALDAGVDEYVMKPLTPETFREKLALVGLVLAAEQ